MKILKWLLIILGVLILTGVIGCFALSEKRPTGEPTSQADALAQNMLNALNYENHKKTTYFRWDFGGRHNFFYDQQRNKAIINWKGNKVIMQLDTQAGTAYADGVEVTGDKKQKLLDKAWAHWCNDSFWMFAPFKVFDPGTTRKIVKDEDGREGLMIEYLSGGVTPGDGYLWLLDDNYMPTGYKMWTSIIPVKGMYASWENYEEHEGAKYATLHNLGFKLEIKDFLASNNLSDFGFEKDPFQ